MMDRTLRDVLVIIAAITIAAIALMFASTSADLWKKKKIKESTEADLRRLVKEVQQVIKEKQK